MSYTEINLSELSEQELIKLYGACIKEMKTRGCC